MKNIKRLLVLLIATVIIALFSIQGFCATTDGRMVEATDANGNRITYRYQKINGNEATINFCGIPSDYTDVEVIIPSEIEGYTVTEIGEEAFEYRYNLKSITFPDTLRKIGNSAFRWCENLESINLPDGLEEIDDYAFACCDSLKSDLYIPESVKSINRSAFDGDCSITSIVFDENSKCKIYENAFGNTSIESITLPKGTECGAAFKTRYTDESEACVKLKTADIQGKPLIYEKVKTIGGKETVVVIKPEYMFEGCKNLETVRFSDDFELYAGMFSGCESIKSVTFGNSLSQSVIPEKAFYGCKSLEKSNINVDLKSVTQVDKEAFYNCENMDFDMQKDFPALNIIGESAFRGCKLLHNLSLENISSLGNYAFAYCDSIKGIEIPNEYPMSRCTFLDCEGIETVTFSGRIGISNNKKAFLGCTGIKTIILDNGFTMKNKVEFLWNFNRIIDLYSLPEFQEFKVGSNELNLFSVDGVLYKSYFDTKSGKELVEVVCYPHARPGEFYSTAKALSGKDCIVALGEESFRETKYLKKLEIAQDCVLLSQYDFGNPDGIRAFYQSSVEEILFLKKSIDYIFSSMFEESNIRTIDLSEAIYIDESAFKNCKNLQNVDLSKCEYIYDQAFDGCESLTNLKLINIREIRTEAFKDCTELRLVNFGINTCGIYRDAFKNCGKVSFFCDENSNAYNYAVANNIPVIAISVGFQNDRYSHEYTGSKIEPGIIVSIGDMTLVRNKDYILTFENNIEVGTATVTVHFIGDFDGLPDAYRVFTITRRNINSAEVEYVVDNEYTGEDIRPSVVVKIDGKVLVEGVDYVIEYSSGTDTGTMLFTIKGRGNYTGTLDCYYNIIRRDISEATVEKIHDCVYTGDEICPIPTLTWNGFTLVYGEDYEVRYFENVNAGFCTAVIYGKGNFCGTQVVKFRIFGKSVENAVVSEIPDQVYDGNEKTPPITVTLDGVKLKEGADYTVEYVNNTEKGTATVIIRGIGNYSGVTACTFRIYKQSVYSFTVFSETQMTETYDGTPLRPEMEVYFGTERLIEGVDYEIRLENNICAGTATVTVIGIGRFEGERTYNFTILPCEISEKDISVSGNLEFNGAPVEPQITVTKNGEILENGKDYVVTYYNNNGVGTAFVTVEGIGNYCSTVNLEYEIYKTDDNDENKNTEPEKPDTETPDNSDNENPSDDNKPSKDDKNENANSGSENNSNVNNGTENAENEPQTPSADINSPSKENNGTVAPQIPNTDMASSKTAVCFAVILAILMSFGVCDKTFRRKTGE